METKYKPAASREAEYNSIRFKPEKRRVFVGGRLGIISGSVSVFTVLVVNLSFTLWILSRRGIKNQRGILHEGNCDEVRNLNIAAHLIINIFSTMTLASSNYCMQYLSALTRAEINKEHARGRWLDIGIPSMRNLRRISRKRVLLWLFLGLTSLPLYLL